MFYSSRRGTSSATRKQTSFASKTTSSKHEDGNKSGNETDCGSAELLDISTSREDLSPSRCSCQSGGSNVAVRNEAREASGEQFWSGNLRLEFDNNGGSDDEQLKDELLRIFDRERLGLESYFKQKTENILAGYRRKQYDWEEKVRLERMEYEKTLAQEKTEVQQSYISEMTNLTKQFNQERVELESHYKKQIQELSQQFELRKKEMDATILKERTELKERLELEYQAMLKSQKAAEEQRYHLQISETEESYKKKIVELEQKLKDSFSEGELSGRRLQSDLEAKFEREKSLVIVEWRKRVELLEVELGKEKVRANQEERKACESVGFLRNEISKKDVELEKLRQVVETLKLGLSQKEKTAKEHEMLQQNIFLRGSDALPGKLREDFEKMLAAHREELVRNFRKEREGLETEREARLVLERETMEKQLKVERERLNLDLEKERSEMRHASREKEDRVRHEVREEMERMRGTLESEKVLLREQLTKEKDEALVKEKQARVVEVAREKEILTEQVRAEVMKEKQEMILKEKEELREKIRTELMNEKQARNDEQHSRFDSLEQQRNKGLMKEKDLREKLPGKSEEEFEANFEGIKSQQGRDQVMVRGDQGLGQNHVRFEAEEAERRRNGLGRTEYEVWLAGQRMQHTKQWVEGQYRFASDAQGYMGNSAEDVQGKNGLDRYGGNRGEDGSDSEEEDQRYVDGKKGKHGSRSDNDGYGEGRDRNDVDNKKWNDDGLKRQGRGALKSQEDSGNHEVISPKNQDLLSSEPDRPTDMSRGKSDDKEYSVQGLKEENEGLKAKVGALQENIELHECFKKEASEEVQRLRNTNKDLKMKLEGLKDTLNDYEELKGTLQDYDEQLKDYEVQLKDNEETLKEYEDICAEYERTLHKCRQRIIEIENDQTSLPVFRKPIDGRNKPEDRPNKLANNHNKLADGQNKPEDRPNKLANNRDKLADGRNKPEDRPNKLADNHNKLADGRNKPEDRPNKLANNRDKLADGRNKPEDRPNKLADNHNKLADGRNKPEDRPNKLANNRDKLADGRNKPEDRPNKLANNHNKLADGQNKPEDRPNKLANNRDKLADGRNKPEDRPNKLADNHNKLADGRNKPEDRPNKLANNRDKLADGRNKPEDRPNKLADNHNKLADGRNKPEDRPNKLANNRDKLADGRNKPEDRPNKLADNHNKLADGRNKPEDRPNKLADDRDKPVNRPNKLTDSRNKLADSRDKLANSRGNLDDSRNKLPDRPNKLANGRDKLANNRDKLGNSRNKLPDRPNKLEDGRDKPEDRCDKHADRREHPESDYKGPKETKYQGIMDDNSDNNGYVRLQDKPRNEMIVDILENERARLEQVVKSLEAKIQLLEIKISETTLHKANTDSTAKLSSDLERVRRQNKCLVNKVKTFQSQFQTIVEKLRKKKKKIANLKDENQSLKSNHQREISDFQRKLEYSSEVITRLQHESSRESSHVSRLKEEISNISKVMKDERVYEQRMIRARSIEEIRDLDRDKVDLERKLNDVRTALDGYSDRLKTKMSYSQTTGSQVSLNTETTLVRDLQLSSTLQALEDTQRTSRHQNERLQHEKYELQTLISKLCKSQEELRNTEGSRTFYKEPLSSHSSSMSSLSSSSASLLGKSGLGSTKFSRTFSIFD
ncbi:Hypothetical predicted protein [Paramuricea clavata]|uniref:Uncharacterized protein n=2 Tax=Paramuricea clavata TaxID=317549 RepID=A0A7D9IER0_PARCT|nr:Hypothetical predicted protein [Paramuricea clavata]